MAAAFALLEKLVAAWRPEWVTWFWLAGLTLVILSMVGSVAWMARGYREQWEDVIREQATMKESIRRLGRRQSRGGRRIRALSQTVSATHALVERLLDAVIPDAGRPA